MAYTAPKTDWVTGDGILNTDLNRIEANTEANHDDTVTNASGIATNVTNISNNDTDIAANLAAIQSNDTDIAANLAAIQSNDTDIAANTGDISSLESTVYDDDRAFAGFQGAGETITVAATTWTHITNGLNNLWTLISADGISLSGDIFTVPEIAYLSGILSLSLHSAVETYRIRAYNTAQSTQEGYYMTVYATGAGQIVNVALPLNITTSASNDTIRLEIYSVGGANPTVEEAVLSMQQIRW